MADIKRPVQIEEFAISLREVPDEQVYAVKRMMNSYIAKLHKTNTKLDKLSKGEEMNDESDEDDEFETFEEPDKHFFKDIIKENGVVIRNYEQRIEAIDNELTHRGLPLDTDEDIDLVHEPTGEHVVIPKPVENGNQGVSSDNDGVDSNAPNSILL